LLILIIFSLGNSETMGSAKNSGALRPSHNFLPYFYLAIILFLWADISFVSGQPDMIEAAPGQPVGTIITLGANADEITIQGAVPITDWALDPIERFCIREGTLSIDYPRRWRVMVSTDEPAGGHMSEYDKSNSAYVPGGNKLKNPLIIKAEGGNDVDLSHGGVLLDGEGKATVPITFIQEASLEDATLPVGHTYRINILFTGLKR
jgi:hypothetical protein